MAEDKGCNCGCGQKDPNFLDLDFSSLERRVLGADWQDFALAARDVPFTVAEVPVLEAEEDEEPEDDRPLCECCGEPFAELDDEDLCDQCGEETRLDREHVRFESQSSLFL